MGESGQALTRSDLELLHEALSYMRKRVFDQGDLVRVRGMIDRIEELLLETPTNARFRLSPPELETLERQVAAYCEALTQRGASEESRQRARRLTALARRIAGRPSEKKGWLRRLLGF